MTIILLGLAAYLLVLFKSAALAAVKTSSEEGVKMALRETQWPKEFARELQKSRGLERQGLRFKSYGALWKELRPLAIYDPTRIDNKTAGDLFIKLTDWYFSECGGLLLTPQARDFYFALQDLLRVTASISTEWCADRSQELAGEHRTFRTLLEARNGGEALKVLDYFATNPPEDWEREGVDLGNKWRGCIKELGEAWIELNERQRFATLQQAGSKLRSSLVNDLESRER